MPAELYIFDEPTSGLDPLMEVVFRHEVARVKDAGATVLLSSHILSEVEQLCDRVSIIRAGRIAESGTLAELRHLTRVGGVVRSDGHRGRSTGFPASTIRGSSEGRAAFTVDSDAVGGVLPALGARNVAGLRVAPPSLEELFLRHYGDDIADEEPLAAAGGAATTRRAGRATR